MATAEYAPCGRGQPSRRWEAHSQLDCKTLPAYAAGAEMLTGSSVLTAANRPSAPSNA